MDAETTERLTRIEVSLEHITIVSEETRDHARATNGRVTQLEGWKSDQVVREDERRRLVADATVAAAAKLAEAKLVDNRTIAKRSLIATCATAITAALIGAGVPIAIFHLA